MNVLRTVTSVAGAVIVAGLAVAVGPAAPAAAVAAPTAAPAPVAPAAGSYVAVTATRILDTRIGRGAPKGPVGPRATVAVRVDGVAAIPSTGVSAVVLNLTVTAPTAGGYITAYPSGQARPATSNINFAAGESRSHLNVLVPGSGGRIALYNGSSGRTQLVADVSGYYTAGTPTAGGAFGSVPLARVLDTRVGAAAPVPASGSVRVALAGKYGLPSSGASAVVLNVTVTNTAATGSIAVDTLTDGRSASPVLHYDGRTLSNLVVAALHPDGSVGLVNGSSSSANVIIDLAGYFVSGAPANPGLLGAVPPSTIEDNRDAVRGIPPAGTLSFAVTGRGGVPSVGVAAVVLDVTVVPGAAGGYLTAYAAGTQRPGTSNVNFGDADQFTSNLVVVPVGSNGQVTVYNGPGNDIEVVIDIVGYVGAVPGPLVWSGPHLVDPPTGALRGISCPTAAFCMATDASGHVLRYNGSTWSAPQAIALESVLTSVSCPSVTFCLAVADDGYITFDGTRWSSVHPSPQLGAVSCASASFCAGTVGDAVVTYNGTSWSKPHPLVAFAGLQSVSCPTTTFCVVGGTYDVWTYRSGTWSAATELQPEINDDASLFVSCSSATFCAAVDDFAQAATFNGSTWSAVTSIGVAESRITSLSCVSASFCMAGGYDGGAVRFTGTSWVVSSTSTGGDHTVACASTSFCASAFHDDRGSVSLFTAGAWHASIGVDPSTNPAQSVSCATPSFCVLLDSSGGVRVFHGAGWTAPTDIDGAGSVFDDHASVSCVSSSFCVAAINGTAIEFDGSTWSAPEPLGLESTSVSCASSSFCVAVGNNSAATFNGTVWQTPVPVASVSSVSCPSSTFCVAVGGSPGRAVTFDGATWGSPVGVTPSGDSLVSVSCVSSSFCAAVSGQGLAYTFDGRQWTTDSGQVFGTFYAVSCASATLCVGVGWNGAGGTAEIWDGSGWSVPLSLDGDRVPDAVSCASTPFCAVTDQSGVVVTGA